MEGPEPEIPQDKAPDSVEIFLIDSNSGINIDLSGSTISSTTLLDIRSKSSEYKLLIKAPKLADCCTIFSIFTFFLTTLLESEVFISIFGLMIITSKDLGEGSLIISRSEIDLTKVIPPKIIGATLSA